MPAQASRRLLRYVLLRVDAKLRRLVRARYSALRKMSSEGRLDTAIAQRRPFQAIAAVRDRWAVAHLCRRVARLVAHA